MTQKAPDEFLRWQGGMFEFLGFVVAISEGDLPVLKLLQSAVADCNPKGIASQIFEHFLAAPGVLDLHVPSWPRRSAGGRRVPHGGRHLVEQSQFFETGLELAFEYFAQSETGNQEGGVFGVDPLLSIGRESARAGQQMDVGMIE